MFDLHAYPWTNFHDPNLNWILSEVKRIEEYLAGGEWNGTDLTQKIRDLQAVPGTTGPGLLRLRLVNETEMTLVNPVAWRTKADSSLFLSFNFRNGGEEAIAANTDLVSFDHLTIDTAESDPDTPRRASLYGITCTFHNTDGTVSTDIPYLKYVTNDKTYFCVDHEIPAGTRMVVYGTAPLSVTKNELILRNKFPRYLARDICDTFLYGTSDNQWKPGDWVYNNGVHRLDPDPQYRLTDCSGMTYIAYHMYQLRPSRSSVATSYLNDGIVIAYASQNVPLDVQNALPGDIICYHRLDDPTRIMHCTLYAGDDVTYEMSAHYTEAEHAHGAVDGRGPYRIYTPASVYKMDQYSGRTIVRYL